MKNLKIYKNRVAAFVLAGTILGGTLVSCKKNKSQDTDLTELPVETKVSDVELPVEDNDITAVVEDTIEKVRDCVPTLNNDIVKNSTIMLLLDVIAPRDVNGKISSLDISKFKSKIDIDNMMNDFNSLLDTMQQQIIESGNVSRISDQLPEKMFSDKTILSFIEDNLEELINYSKENNKEKTLEKFKEFYEMFVNGKENSSLEFEFTISKLSYPGRAVANAYAEVATYFSRNYISESEYNHMDKILNDQNNKAYMREVLAILSNQMIERSEVDVISLFNSKYEEISKYLEGKVDLSEECLKDLVNYANIKYLNSDRVSNSDKNSILGEYSSKKINSVIVAIDAISNYNQNNQDNIFAFSDLLVEEYLKTESGKADEVALDYTEFNSIKLIDTSDNLNKNPYYENIIKYFSKQNILHLTKNNAFNVNWQEISDGVNFINYEVILNTLSKLPEGKNLDNYKELTQDDLIESVVYLQKTITGECIKTDLKEFVKVK